MNHHAAFRIEIHATEAGAWFSQLWNNDSNGDLHPLWESRMYHSMDEAYDAVKYEADERAESAREVASIARLNDDGAGIANHAQRNGVSGAGHL